MTYEETLAYLFASTPDFQRVGGAAYKPGLDRSHALDAHADYPHKSYRTIHVGGTNGKGSVSHLLAAILQESGYKTGLFTSPHLVDFRERIRVNGIPVSQEYVVDYVAKHNTFYEQLKPSFFEVTSSMAFDYFKEAAVDIALVEVGLGGRLDSTNIISPMMSVITNISLDHMQYLGDSIEEIATEKSGIIKPHTPVVIGNADELSVHSIFIDRTDSLQAPIVFAKETEVLKSAEWDAQSGWTYETVNFGQLKGELNGWAQEENAATVLTAVQELRKLGLTIPDQAVKQGFEKVVELTGLKGRWQTLQNSPHVVCDTGHNSGGWVFLGKQLEQIAASGTPLRMVVGMVNDKDIHSVLRLMPKNATYYFTQPSNERALPASFFRGQAAVYKLEGTAYPSVELAIKAALAEASPNDFIFIGGSTFIVADALPLFENE